MTKIVELRAENFKRLVAINIKPDGSMVVVGGANGAGKSSCLDAIAAVIGGKAMLPAEPLRRGAEKGQAVVTLDDGTVIKRTFTANGGDALSLTNKDGARYGSPQAMLDGLVGRLSFDPLAFSRMDSKVQAATLRELVGLDLGALDLKRKAAYDQRTDVSREVKRLEGALAKLPPAPSDAPESEVSIDDLAAELENRRAHNAKRAHLARGLEQLRESSMTIKRRIAALEVEIETDRAGLEQVIATGKAQAAELTSMSEADEAEVLAQIKKLQDTNAAARAASERRKLAAELEHQTTKALELTGVIQKVDDEKRAKLEATKMPIEGLGFGDDGVTLGGLPLEQASSAEQLRASVAIGLAMHPKLKVLLVRDGSLLDEKSLAMVSEMAAAAEAQVWVERVGKGEECTVIIEDGQVQAASAEPVAVAPPADAASIPDATKAEREANFKAKAGAQYDEPGSRG